MKIGPCLSMILSLISLNLCACSETVSNDAGWRVRVDKHSGAYSISAKSPDWTVGGTVAKPLSDVASSDGKDNIGRYHEISFHWTQEGHRTGNIRLYESRPLVLFSERFDDAVTGCPAAFPVISHLPANLMAFRYGEKDHLRDLSFQLKGLGTNEPYGGPFLLFDSQANSMILSPASDFMIAKMDGDLAHGLSSGFNSTLKNVPAGYTHQTILALAPGINKAWDIWGHGLTDLYAKKRPANDADTGLKYLGYWTDNGSYYYYNYDPEKGYASTLIAEKQHLEDRGVPIHYLQLDSWWYPKTFNSVQSDASNKPRSKNPKIPAGTWNRYGGLLDYSPHPFLFPDGLLSFQKRMDVSLITHNRWVDPQSPYHTNYQISGIAAVDPKWWNKIISDIAGWGVQTYEQDWNNFIYRRSPDLFSTTWAGDAYMDGMANACAGNGLTMQYCMVLPRNLMQGGAKYSNLTTVRVSGDRFEPKKWQEFLFGSQMASALGVWPWTDVFRSSETPNILIATLSAGMVGLSDEMGQEDLLNISRAVREDGVIVKPDVPLTPIDASYISLANGGNTPTLCATTTNHSDAGTSFTAVYLFVYSPKKAATTQKSVDFLAAWSLKPASIRLTGDVCDYDFFTGDANIIPSDQTLTGNLGKEGWTYHILIPIGLSRMALIGDPGKFVTRGKARIESIHDDTAGIQTCLLAAPGEKSVKLAVYAPAQPTVTVGNGSCRQISYDTGTKIATAEIAVDPGAKQVTISGDSVIRVNVSFKLP